MNLANFEIRVEVCYQLAGVLRLEKMAFAKKRSVTCEQSHACVSRDPPLRTDHNKQFALKLCFN